MYVREPLHTQIHVGAPNNSLNFMGNANDPEQKGLDSKHYAYDVNGVGLPTFCIYLTGQPKCGKTSFLKSICRDMRGKDRDADALDMYSVGVR